MTNCPSRFALARLEVGDLPEDEAARVLAHVASCEACGRSVADLRSNVAAYEARGDEHRRRLMARIDGEGAIPLTPRRRSLRMPLSIGGGLAAAAALVLGVYLTLGGAPPKPGGDDGIRYKGVVSVEVVAKRGDRQFRVEPGSALLENDALRFIVTTGTPGYMDLFSVDSKGRVSPFYPESEPDADPAPMTLGNAGRHVLPGSVILDDALGEEHIVLVFSEAVFDRDEVQKEIRSTGAMGPRAIIGRPGGDGALIVERLTIRKE